MTDLTTTLHTYLTRAPASLFAGSAVEIVDAWEGDDHLLWRVAAQGQDAVVKLFMDAGQARSRRQFDGHQVFAPRGLAPQPRWADRYPEGLARQVIVYSWAAGEPVNPNDWPDLEGWADAVARLHAVELDEVRRFSPHPVNLDYYWRIEAASLDQIRQWLAPESALGDFLTQVQVRAERAINAGLDHWRAARPAAVHGDLRIAHSLVDRGSVVFLDWELFGLGDAALDVAGLLHRERRSMGTDRQRHWLDVYLRTSDQPDLEARIELYRQLLTLHDVVFLLIGLEQQGTAGVNEELVAALPFLSQTLYQALHATAATFGVPLPDTTAVDLTAIFARLHTTRT
jgi:aminoglycoside phosphotransferase (APT) family kinase protein